MFLIAPTSYAHSLFRSFIMRIRVECYKIIYYLSRVNEIS